MSSFLAPRWLAALSVMLIGATMLAGCGSDVSAADCRSVAAWVGSSSIPETQYDQLLRYTLGFYENTNPRSHYYHQDICRLKRLNAQCASIRRALLDREIDQQVVATYATHHNLMPSSSEWVKALKAESAIVRVAGGQTGFLSYLHTIGISEAQFRFLESQQIETANVSKAIGAAKFRPWLRKQESRLAIVRCDS